MKPSATINLLIPFLDGDYYGTIFTTLHEELQKHDALLYAIQSNSSLDNPAMFDHQVGAAVADGWLLMSNPRSALPASSEFMRSIEATGKPIVTIGYRESMVQSHAIMIDSRRAAKEAVLHLIREHGHRRIAYVGSREHVDLTERFEGYLEALQEEGISYDDSLYYETNYAVQTGGIIAAQAMLTKGIDFTAIFAATDLIAMAVIETLQEAGFRIPEDIAVIGFDDLVSSETFHPPLTTVRQSFIDLAKLSVEAIFRQMNGEIFEESTTYLQTELILRSSCGCPYESRSESNADVQKKWVYAESNIHKIIDSHHHLARNWAAASRTNNFHFSNLFMNYSHWGCLALWDPNDPERKHLIIEQVFSKYDAPVPPIGTRIPLESFPPPEWIHFTGDKDFVRIQAIRSKQGDLGFVVIVGSIDEFVAIAGADIIRVSFVILAAALERDSLFNQIRSIAEQLEIVSRTTNDGIWDLDLTTNQVQWNERTYDMFRSIREMLPNDLDSFLSLIHQEDVERVRQDFINHIEYGAPFKSEFRIQGSNGELWVYAAGDSIRDSEGKCVRIIGSLNNITQKKQAEQQIMHFAYHDILTGLPNRLMLQKQFRMSKERADRYHHKLGMLLIDLDRFKIINDTLGHQAGDELLQQVANKFKAVVASIDERLRGDEDRSTVARLGGDEFVILVPGVQEVEELEFVADQIIHVLKEPFQVTDHEVYTSASIGISMYPDDGTDLDTLKRCADIAMYMAKDSGRNSHQSYSSKINNLTIERLTLENELRKALERQELTLHYQPQINLLDGKVIGVEALLRWHSSLLGAVSPGEFIPIAEESGQIISIGEWVLTEACRQNQRWIESGMEPMMISVNISATQLEKPDFVEMVKDILTETGLSPHLLCLEITESTAFMNLENSRTKLQKLSELGILIAIDDFGTGYSSFAMLKHLPIQNIKIDRSFISDMDIDHDNAAIVNAMIAMSRSLNLTVIAEGVETETQRDMLMKDGCVVQGYFYSRPLPADECFEYIRYGR